MPSHRAIEWGLPPMNDDQAKSSDQHTNNTTGGNDQPTPNGISETHAKVRRVRASIMVLLMAYVILFAYNLPIKLGLRHFFEPYKQGFHEMVVEPLEITQITQVDYTFEKIQRLTSLPSPSSFTNTHRECIVRGLHMTTPYFSLDDFAQRSIVRDEAIDWIQTTCDKDWFSPNVQYRSPQILQLIKWARLREHAKRMIRALKSRLVALLYRTSATPGNSTSGSQQSATEDQTVPEYISIESDMGSPKFIIHDCDKARCRLSYIGPVEPDTNTNDAIEQEQLTLVSWEQVFHLVSRSILYCIFRIDMGFHWMFAFYTMVDLGLILIWVGLGRYLKPAGQKLPLYHPKAWMAMFTPASKTERPMYIIYIGTTLQALYYLSDKEPFESFFGSSFRRVGLLTTMVSLTYHGLFFTIPGFFRPKKSEKHKALKETYQLLSELVNEWEEKIKVAKQTSKAKSSKQGAFWAVNPLTSLRLRKPKAVEPAHEPTLAAAGEIPENVELPETQMSLIPSESSDEPTSPKELPNNAKLWKNLETFRNAMEKEVQSSKAPHKTDDDLSQGREDLEASWKALGEDEVVEEEEEADNNEGTNPMVNSDTSSDWSFVCGNN